MATKALQKIWTAFDGAILFYKWVGLANGDDGEPLTLPNCADKTIQFTGTWGTGGSVTLQGSCMPESPVWATLNDPQGNPITKLADSIETILENPYQIRPLCTAGTGTSLDIYVAVRR